MKIYCYETKEQFNDVEIIAKLYNTRSSVILKLLNNPNETFADYHWCTKLDIFDCVELTSSNDRVKIPVYCYETKEKFDNVTEAAKKYNIKSNIYDVLDKPNRTAGSYHWCTNLDKFDELLLTKNNELNKVQVYCYETKNKFDSLKEATEYVGLANASYISIVLDNPNKVAGGYHWCTDLNKFDDVLLLGGSENTRKVVYCYETKEKFNSIKEAQAKYNIFNISIALDNPNKTSGNFHWCTSLDKFDGIDFSDIHIVYNNIQVYCYETKEKFNSIKEAQAKYNIKTNIKNVLDNPNRTASKLHWCTSLDKFDGVELSGGIASLSRVIYCYETKEKFESIAAAQKKYNINNISQILDNPNKSAGGYHWCTDLSVFDNTNTKLTSSKDKSVVIYCYETKEKFDSIRQAEKKYKARNISTILNNPNKTSGNYHWCTNLTIFDSIKLNKGSDLVKIPVYCYETKEKFDSLNHAAIFINISNGSGIGQVIDNPKRTAGNYHWCTDLSLFNPEDLVYPDSGTSAQEKEIVDFIKSIYNNEVIANTKSVIAPYELDIYIPELNLAFEFNGDYWHSEQAGKDKNYHSNKTNLCNDKNIQLIHIFEYQYRENPIIIKSMIMNKLNKNRIKLYARNSEVKLITDNNEVRNFLEENHIQGYVNSSISLGLYCNNILVSIMTFGKSRFDKSIEYELLRYASLRSTNVIGGASKLLKYFEKIYTPKSLISYADISYSNGNLYTKLGFNFIGTSNPDYVNIKNNVVYPRYQTMKHKLPKLLGEENFDINLTEQQNLDNNGFFRVWKCGNLKYLKEYNE